MTYNNPAYNQSRSLLTDDRLKYIEETCKQVSHLDGNTAEVGVYRGGTSALIASALPHKIHYCFDTFEGIPNVDVVVDGHQHHNKDFNDVNFNEIEAYLNSYKNIVIKRGLFPDTAVDELFCFAHIDGDTYQTTKDALEWFYPRMVQGGVMIFDDWLWEPCPGVGRAIIEFVAHKEIGAIQVISTVLYQCKIVK